jgi:hypothetical protein
VPWLALAGGCVVIAAIYAVVWPRPKGSVPLPLWRHLLLRWGHSAVWLLLAMSFLARTAGDTATAAANGIAISALALYVVFLVAAFAGRSAKS